MKVVLDTNVLLVSISDRSKKHEIFRALMQRRYDLIVTTDVLLEYEEIIGREMGREVAENVMGFMAVARNIHRIRRYYYWNLIKTDPDDDKFADAAVAGNADLIVSDDSDFRILKKSRFPKFKLLTSDEFLEML